MELTFSKYWKEILSNAESEGIVGDTSTEQLDFIKKKAKTLYNKDVDVYHAYERLVELF